MNGRLESAEPAEKWHVIHTKPQREKKLADYLKRNAVVYYLPLLDSIRYYQNRKVAFTKPIFPGYLFARFNPALKNIILLSGYLVSFLKVPNEKELLTELANIYYGRKVQAELVNTTWLEQGWEVEIVTGPMQGLTGVVQNQAKLDEVVLQVKILRQAVSVRVNPSDVKLVKEFRNI